MRYYHGTDKVFREFDIAFALEYKDFGTGIYLAQEEWHAEAIAKRKNKQHAFVRVYDLDIAELKSTFNVKEFKKAKIPWVKFVLQNRNEIVPPKYDIVIGATADARAQDILENFYYRFRKREPSQKEYKQLITDLQVYNYPTQMCLLTQRAVDYVNKHCIKVIDKNK